MISYAWFVPRYQESLTLASWHLVMYGNVPGFDGQFSHSFQPIKDSWWPCFDLILSPNDQSWWLPTFFFFLSLDRYLKKIAQAMNKAGMGQMKEASKSSWCQTLKSSSQGLACLGVFRGHLTMTNAFQVLLGKANNATAADCHHWSLSHTHYWS